MPGLPPTFYRGKPLFACDKPAFGGGCCPYPPCCIGISISTANGPNTTQPGDPPLGDPDRTKIVYHSHCYGTGDTNKVYENLIWWIASCDDCYDLNLVLQDWLTDTNGPVYPDWEGGTEQKDCTQQAFEQFLDDFQGVPTLDPSEPFDCDVDIGTGTIHDPPVSHIPLQICCPELFCSS